MPLINQEIFVDTLAKHPEKLTNVYNYLTAGGRNAINAKFALKQGYPVAWRDLKIDRASALEVLSSLRENLVVNSRQLNKGLRPWDFSSDTMKHLDRKEPWWGWEFETGWTSDAARRQALEFAWDNFDGAMFDSEGEGNVQVEITFMPAEQSKYLDGTADACKFMDWVEAHKKLTYNSLTNNVGTHLNMSDSRILNGGDTDNVARFLNRTVMATMARNGDRKKLFGRESVYGGFYPQAAAGNVWMEFKGFRTTYDRAQFGDYIMTAAALQKVIDKIFELGLDRTGNLCVTNLYAVAFEGADPVVMDFDKRPATAIGAAPLHTRGGFGRTEPVNGPKFGVVKPRPGIDGGAVMWDELIRMPDAVPPQF